MRERLAIEHAAEATEIRRLVASAMLLFEGERRNDVTADAVFEWINGNFPARWTIDEVKVPMVSLPRDYREINRR